MSDESCQQERGIAIPTARKPVPFRDGAFVILPNSRNQGSKLDTSTPSAHHPGSFVASTSNDRPIKTPSFSQLAVVPQYQHGSIHQNNTHAHTHTHAHEDTESSPAENSPRPILQSFNSSFSKPSTFSKPSRSSGLFRTNVIEKDENITIQSMSPQSEQYSSFSIGSTTNYCQEQDDDHVSLGTFFRRQGNKLSCQSNPTTGGIRVSPFEPIVCDRNLPRQGRISPLPMPEYEVWTAQRRVRETTAKDSSDLSKNHRLLLKEEDVGDLTRGENQTLEDDMQFRPVSITPTINTQYKGFIQRSNGTQS